MPPKILSNKLLKLYSCQTGFSFPNSLKTSLIFPFIFSPSISKIASIIMAYNITKFYNGKPQRTVRLAGACMYLLYSFIDESQVSCGLLFQKSWLSFWKEEK